MSKKKLFNEIFTRLRELERSHAVNLEHDKILESMFKEHDEKEMKKHDKINDSLDSLKKNQFIAFGILIAYEYFTKS